MWTEMCSVTQIIEGGSGVGKETLGFPQKIQPWIWILLLAPNGSSGRKKLGQSPILPWPISDLWREKNWSTIVGQFQFPCLYPKSAIPLNFCWFFGFSKLFLGRTASGSQFARGHELFTYSHRTSGRAPAAVPCPCPSASTGPERDFYSHLLFGHSSLWVLFMDPSN